VKKKPVILQIVPALISGGVERGVIDIARAIKDQGFTSLVVSAGGGMTQQLASYGIQHIVMPVASKNPIRIYLNSRQLIRLIRGFDVDIVHARSRAPAWSALWACRKTGCHFMTTWHGTYSLGGKYKKLYNAVMGKGERVIAVSNFIKDHILRHYLVDPDRIRVIHRGVDIDKFVSSKVTHERVARLGRRLNTEHDRPIILLPARLTEWKGHLFLLDALQAIKDIPFLCVFVGKEEKKHQKYRMRVQEKIKKLGLMEHVCLIDHVTDMPALYYLSDIVVSASLRPEAFGRVVPEAQAMGRLVVATGHGGACETVIDGKTGWLVEPGNVEQLSATLRRLLQLNNSERKTVTDAAREYVKKHFSLQRMKQDTLAVYKELVGLSS
jgi:glycosyltransferase involved in cell wall biosynthesis